MSTGSWFPSESVQTLLLDMPIGRVQKIWSSWGLVQWSVVRGGVRSGETEKEKEECEIGVRLESAQEGGKEGRE